MKKFPNNALLSALLSIFTLNKSFIISICISKVSQPRATNQIPFHMTKIRLGGVRLWYSVYLHKWKFDTCSSSSEYTRPNMKMYRERLWAISILREVRWRGISNILASMILNNKFRLKAIKSMYFIQTVCVLAIHWEYVLFLTLQYTFYSLYLKQFEINIPQNLSKEVRLKS
jgi:hypothetical protein